MPRPSNSLVRRAQIVDGLLAVMSSLGYERASIAAIAQAAGLAPGLLHYHFHNKQQILVALVERLVQNLGQRYQVRLARAGDDPRARLWAYVDAHLARGADADPRAVAAWVVIGTEAVRQPEVRAVYAAAIADGLAELQELFRACLRAEGRSTRQTRRQAAAVLAAIEGAYQLSAAAPGVLPEGYAARTLRLMIEGLLDGAPAGDAG